MNVECQLKWGLVDAVMTTTPRILTSYPPSDLWGWDYQHIRQKLMLRSGETGVTDQSRQRPAPQTAAKH